MSAEVTTVKCELQQTKLIDTFNLTSIYLYYFFVFRLFNVMSRTQRWDKTFKTM